MAAIRRGRLVLHPTETVVSLTGDPWSERAVDAATSIKGYDTPRPFLCLVRDIDAATALTSRWTAAATALASSFWPGALTLILRPSESAPMGAISERGFAVRVASDVVSLALLEARGEAVFSTSANRRGQPASSSVPEAVRALSRFSEGAIAIAIVPEENEPGDPSTRPPSTIVDAVEEPPTVIRVGAIEVGALREVVPDLRV